MYRICLVMLSICIVIVCCVFHFNTRMILCIYCITTIVLMFLMTLIITNVVIVLWLIVTYCTYIYTYICTL